jgi:hypothetical protein
VGTLAALGLLVFGNLLQARSDSVPQLAKITAAASDWSYQGDRTIPGDTREAVLFFGDSHMQQFLPRIEALMQNSRAARRTVIFRTRPGCAPVPGIERPGYECEKFVDATYALARRADIRTVIVSASWYGFADRTDYFKSGAEEGAPLKLFTPETDWVLERFETAISQLVSAGKQVVIVLSSPHGKQFDPREMARRDGLDFHVVLARLVPRPALSSESGFVDHRIAGIAARAHARVLDPLDTICDPVMCPTVDADGIPLLRDESHLRSSFVTSHFDAFDRYVLHGNHLIPKGS